MFPSLGFSFVDHTSREYEFWAVRGAEQLAFLVIGHWHILAGMEGSFSDQEAVKIIETLGL